MPRRRSTSGWSSARSPAPEAPATRTALRPGCRQIDPYGRPVAAGTREAPDRRRHDQLRAASPGAAGGVLEALGGGRRRAGCTGARDGRRRQRRAGGTARRRGPGGGDPLGGVAGDRGTACPGRPVGGPRGGAVAASQWDAVRHPRGAGAGGGPGAGRDPTRAGARPVSSRLRPRLCRCGRLGLRGAGAQLWAGARRRRPASEPRRGGHRLPVAGRGPTPDPSRRRTGVNAVGVPARRR